MKKRVTMEELKKYCAANKPANIQFSTENQVWHRVSDPCKVNLSFPIMLIYENPNLICLQSGANTLSFDRVRFVEIDTETTVLGTIFTLFCGSSAVPEDSITYRLVVA
jgi:hypothetical protein